MASENPYTKGSASALNSVMNHEQNPSDRESTSVTRIEPTVSISPTRDCTPPSDRTANSVPTRDRFEEDRKATIEANHSETRGSLPPVVHQLGQTITVNGPTGGVERFLRRAYRETLPVDGVIVLTTERSATDLLRDWTETTTENRTGIGIIDTRSEGQYVADVYRRSPIHYTAADGDIERTAMSLTGLVETLSTTPAQRLHLVVDSYAAFSESLTTEECTRLLNTFHSQIDGYQIYVTDGDVDEYLGHHRDGTIWVEERSDETIRTRYQRR
jgi:hypothetical protein